MRAIWAVIVREWTERRLLILAAALLGLFPWIAPFLPGFELARSNETREAACLLITALFGLGTVVLLGSGLTAKDLIDGRLGFYLSRPLPEADLWTGKVLGAVSILITCLLLIVLPTVLSNPSLGPDLSQERGPAVPLSALSEFYSLKNADSFPQALPLALQALGVALVFVALLMLIHWAYLAFGTRSPWLLIDAVGFGLVLFSGWLLWSTLISIQGFGALAWLERLWVITLPIILWSAGVVQMRAAGNRPVKAHQSYSLSAWLGIALLILASAGYARWIVSGDSADLVTLEAATVNPSGTHVLIGGTLGGRAGRQAAFIVPVSPQHRGSEHSAGSLVPVRIGWRWSADGTRAIWTRCNRIVPLRCEVWTQDLLAGTPPRPTGIEVSPGLTRFAVSKAGRLLALGKRRGVEVYSVDTGRLVASLKTPEILDLGFLSPSRIRIRHFPDEEDISYQVLRVFNLETRKSEVTGRLPGDFYDRFYAQSADGKYLLFHSIVPRRHEIRDALTGEVVADLNELLSMNDGTSVLGSARFSEDGRLILVRHRAGDEYPRDQASGDFEVLAVGPFDDRSTTPAVARATIESARSVRLGPSLEADGITLLVDYGREMRHPTHQILTELGLEPSENLATYIFRPEVESLRVFAHGFVPVPLHHNRLGSPRPGTVFWAKGQALFYYDGEEGRVIFPGVPPENVRPTLHGMAF